LEFAALGDQGLLVRSQAVDGLLQHRHQLVVPIRGEGCLELGFFGFELLGDLVDLPIKLGRFSMPLPGLVFGFVGWPFWLLCKLGYED
jgi:hypothetical protein